MICAIAQEIQYNFLRLQADMMMHIIFRKHNTELSCSLAYSNSNRLQYVAYFYCQRKFILHRVVTTRD